MKLKLKYTDEHLGKAQVLTGFLSFPADLVFREEELKVTLKSCKKIIQAHTKPPCHSHAVSNAGAPPNSGNVA